MKKLLVGVITALCCFAAATSAFAGCGQSSDSGADKTDELQTKIEELQAQVSELREENEELKESVKDNNSLVAEIQDLKEIIKNYVDAEEILKSRNEFALHHAYYLGLIDRSDVESIANYNNNEVDYPEALTEEEAKAIKEAVAENLRNDVLNPFPEAKAEGITIRKFLGNYKGLYAVKLHDSYQFIPTDVPNYWDFRCGVPFHIIGHDYILLYKINL